MKSFLYCFFLIAAISPLTTLYAQNRKPVVQPIPAWVTVRPIDYTNNKLDQQAEDGYVNMSLEKQVSLPQKAVYNKMVVKILSEAGVQNSSEVNVNFDPAHNQLIFHTIKIIRDGVSIDKLQLSKLKVIQQETELNRHLYDGSLSAILFLEDVRKGDIIEYSYTIKGVNPVFNGKSYGVFSTSFSVPIYNMYYKLVVPTGSDMQIRNILTDHSYTVKESAREKTYEWQLKDVPALRSQDHLPPWYDPFPVILTSDYRSWKEVNDWALQLFPLNSQPAPALKMKIEEIRSANETPEQRTLAALRFVQDDIRYLGIEMGKNSHKPNGPDKIFAQRFGDCKDKSYLLCVMLKHLGVEASPVLINTEARQKIREYLPGPIFDHATVRVRLNDRFYYFDPTIAWQRGAINDISYPDYQCGLVVHDTTTSLTNIPLQSKGKVVIREQFDIRDMTGPARLLVETAYSGTAADDTRSEFHNNSVFEMQKRYQEFYSRYYEKIITDSVTYADDERSGVLTTKEYYTIKDIWEEEKGVKKAYFSPYVINGVMKKPKEMDRTMPFYVEYPATFKEEVVINLPEEWNAEEFEENIQCAAFRLQAKAFYTHKKFRLVYDYESLKDHVMPGEADQYYKSFDQADENIHYTLSDPQGSMTAIMASDQKKNSSSNTGYIVFSVLLVVGLVVWWTQRG